MRKTIRAHLRDSPPELWLKITVSNNFSCPRGLTRVPLHVFYPLFWLFSNPQSEWVKTQVRPPRRERPAVIRDRRFTSTT